MNKIDLLDTEPEGSSASDRFFISATTGAGIEGLIDAIVRFAGETLAHAEPALVTRERQRARLTEVNGALRDAMVRAGQGAGDELVAEDLRHALAGLGRLTGRLDVEEVLDVIFREFCVGK